MVGKKAPASYHCAMCDRQFNTKARLTAHIDTHEDSKPADIFCDICNWSFSDSLALEGHKLQAGHATPRFACEACGQGFVNPQAVQQHKVASPECDRVLSDSAVERRRKTRDQAKITCDRCAKHFENRQEYDRHRSFRTNGPCADHNHTTPPKNRVGYEAALASARKVPSHYAVETMAGDTESDAPTNLSDGVNWCSRCKNVFRSAASYVAHSFGCVTKHGAVGHPTVQDISTRQPSEVHRATPPATQQSRSGVSLSVTNPQSASFACSSKGCAKTFRSEAGLKQHKADVHGVDGRGLDLNGKDSWMLNPQVREKMKAQGLLQPPISASSRGGSRRRGGRLPPSPPPSRARQHFTPEPIPAFGTIPAIRPPPPMPAHSARMPSVMPVLPPSQNIGGALEMEQAKHVQGKMLPLLIQSDIFIHHDGKMTVCDMDWKRISVEKQRHVVGVFDQMSHLSLKLKGEYLPPPKTFSSDYQLQYSMSEFAPSPARDGSKPRLDVVAVACSKVVLENGLLEVVKIAAVNVLTCRILMNHLVCTKGTAKVKDWRSKETGLYSWGDMEQARQLGYKVYKGWCSARSALHKFIDQETILVGHNLRSNLDALRMVHGRAVDIAKVAEKAANGPLSRPQLRLESLCSEFLGVTLKDDADYGRDTLVNAFAARELGLWIIKNKEGFEKKIAQKSLDYQKMMSRAA
ncbi:hypothetical protein ACEQ8H_006100 [Pleosporales sp. CAS-2024a]